MRGSRILYACTQAEEKQAQERPFSGLRQTDGKNGHNLFDDTSAGDGNDGNGSDLRVAIPARVVYPSDNVLP